MDPLPSLNALKAFESVARHLNFTRAAKELCVTQGAVSRQVKNLEDELSTPLFVRVPNQLSLTKEGQILFQGVRTAFQTIRDARKSISKTVSKFKILAAPTIATRWLNPRIYRFQEKYPALQIQLETSVSRIDFRVTTGFDTAISYGKPAKGSGMAYTELLQEFLYPVCSPKIKAGLRSIQNPMEMTGACLLHSSLGQVEWKAWAKQQGMDTLAGIGDQRFELEESTIQAAKAGAGIALVNLDFIRDEMASGELVKLFPDIPPLFLNAYYLVYPGNKSLPPLLKEFKAWVLSERDLFLTASEPGFL